MWVLMAQSSKERSAKHYKNNKAAVLARHLETKQAKRMLLLDHLLRHPCIECGEDDPVVLDFDHRDPAEKSFSVANGISARKSEAALIAEIAKCDVRCANCHRRRTARQFNWFRYRETKE